MTVGGVSFSNYKEPVKEQAAKQEAAVTPTLKELLKHHAVKIPSDSKVSNQFLTFAKITKDEGGRVDIKLADFKHFEKKLIQDSLAMMTKEQLAFLKDTAGDLTGKKGIVGEFGREISKALEEAESNPTTDVDSEEDMVQSEGDEAATEGSVAVDPEDMIESEGDEAVEGSVTIEEHSVNAGQYTETQIREKIAKSEYQPVLVSLDEEGNATLALENPDHLSPSELQNAELRFKYSVGERPLTITTRSLQVIELDKNSPVLAKAFVALLAGRGHIIDSEPSIITAGTRPQEDKKSIEGQGSEDQSVQGRVQTRKQTERTAPEEDKKSKKAAEKETAAMHFSSVQESSVTAGSDKARRKRLDAERERRQERVREDIIKNDIQSTERKKEKISENTDHDKIIKKAKNTVEGIAPEKEI